MIRPDLLRWTIHVEHHDDDGEPLTPRETEHGSGRLGDLATVVERLGSCEPSSSPLGDGPDGVGYSPWLSFEPEPDYCRGGWTRATLHVERVGRHGRRRAGATTIRRILRAAGITVR